MSLAVHAQIIAIVFLNYAIQELALIHVMFREAMDVLAFQVFNVIQIFVIFILNYHYL